MDKIQYGKTGEDIVSDYLKKKRYKIIERNYKLNFGEIDIIAKHKKTLVFIEVKRRSSLKYGTPAEAVTKHKQIKIAQTATQYILSNNLQDSIVRFDVIEVSGVEINHIIAAFESPLQFSY